MDNKFISELKKGNEQAFYTLVDMYSKQIYYLSLKILGNPSDSEDAVQTTFFKVFTGINKFENRSKLSTWIYKIAVNSCHDILRKRKTSFTLPLTVKTEENGEMEFDCEDESENIEEKLIKKERDRLIYKCLYNLTENQRNYIVLRDLEGLSYSEIAEILDINIGTVKSGIYRARTRMAELIRKESLI